MEVLVSALSPYNALQNDGLLYQEAGFAKMVDFTCAVAQRLVCDLLSRVPSIGTSSALVCSASFGTGLAPLYVPVTT